jgi:hypothetical protein
MSSIIEVDLESKRVAVSGGGRRDEYTRHHRHTQMAA